MIMKNAGFWLGVIFLIVSILFLLEATSFTYSSSFGPGPGLFPTIVGAVFGVFSLLYIVQTLREQAVKFSDLFPKGKGLYKFILVFADILLFIAIVKYTGFLIAGTLFIFILLYKEYRWYVNLLISFCLSGVLFLIFHTLLKVSLPTLW